MATRKSGPVKPPVLDLSAKKTGPKPAPAKTAGKPSGEKTTSGKTGAPASPVTAAPSSSARSKSPFFLGSLVGALGGGVLGVVLMLALLASGVLQPLLFTAQDPQFVELGQRVGINREQISEGLVGYAAIDEKVVGLDSQVFGFNQTLERQANQFQVQLDDINRQLDDFSSQYRGLSETVAGLQALTDLPAPADTGFDPGPLESQIALLDARIDGIAAGASTQDAQKLASDLAGMGNRLANQGQKLAELAGRLETIAGPVAALGATLDGNSQAVVQNKLQIAENSRLVSELAAQIADLPAAINSRGLAPGALQLPLALMGMETALERGRPFALELASLKSLLPDLAVEENLLAVAQSGLLRPDQLVDGFEKRFPAVLGARPADPDAGWQQALWERVMALVALRPSSEAGLTGIDAVIVGAENAVKRRDFAAAAAAIAQLPAPMRAELGELSQSIADMGAAQSLLARARTKALGQSQASGVDQ